MAQFPPERLEILRRYSSRTSSMAIPQIGPIADKPTGQEMIIPRLFFSANRLFAVLTGVPHNLNLDNSTS
jgi:hypothetical protein